MYCCCSCCCCGRLFVVVVVVGIVVVLFDCCECGDRRDKCDEEDMGERVNVVVIPLLEHQNEKNKMCTVIVVGDERTGSVSSTGHTGPLASVALRHNTLCVVMRRNICEGRL